MTSTTYYISSDLYELLIDKNEMELLKLPIDLYMNEYLKFVELFPKMKKAIFEKAPKNIKLKQKLIIYLYDAITAGKIKKQLINVYYMSEKDYYNIIERKKKLLLSYLKPIFSDVNNHFTIDNYSNIINELKGDKLRTEIFKIINEYISLNLIKPKAANLLIDDASKSKTKPKTKPKSISPLDEKNDEIIEIKVNKANSKYKQYMKKELADIDTNEFNLNKLRNDINDDAFITKAIEGEIKALEFKFKTYSNLALVDWHGQGKDNQQQPMGKINEMIEKLKYTINEKINYLKKSPYVNKEKRNELLNIIDDPDNGIASIKGTSRESLRISLIKIIYMFIEVPLFFFKGFNNFILTGPPGSGKTKVASVIANLMKNLGILATTNVIMATRQNLVAEFTGQSGPKTRNLLSNGLEGVVFIDEAYTLTPCKEKNYHIDNLAEEAVGELINFIDKFIGCIVIIVAGYKDKMNDCFLKFNEGMSRRFPKQIELLPYNSKDLFNIFEIFLNDSIDIKTILTTEQRHYIKGIIKTLNENDVFNNQAGDMLNLSKVIGEDAILNSNKYDKKLIKLSFKKFCLAKDIAIEL